MAMGAAGVIDPETVRDVERAFAREDLSVEAARPESYGEIEALSRSAPADEVRSPLTADLVSWFVDRNPAGPGFVVVVRDPASGEMVGHFVFYRWTLARRAGRGPAERFPAYLYVRLYVDPRYRRRGLFTTMTTFGLELAQRLGVGLAYTAPNPKSAAGFVKLGMETRGPLPFWVRPAWPPWRWVGGPAGGAWRVTVERREAFDDTFDGALEASLPAATTVWSPRDAATLNWRYLERPDVGYEIRYLTEGERAVGYLVTRRMTIGGRAVVAVCDAWTEPRCAVALRVGLEDALAGGEGVRLAIAVGGAATPALRRAYRRAALVRVPTSLLPQPVAILGGGVGEPPARRELPAESTWHLTPYDWDVF